MRFRCPGAVARSLEVFFALVWSGVQSKSRLIGEASSGARRVVLGEPMADRIILEIGAGRY